MIEGIVECLEILTLQIDKDIMKGNREKEDIMKIEDISCVTSVTTQDTLLRIVIHVMINRILEAEHQYVNYVTTLDIQQRITKWT